MSAFEKKVAFLFDIDGVVLDTPHEEAWRKASIEWGLIGEDFSFAPFYEQMVAGLPGIAGARNILQYLSPKNDRLFFEKNSIGEVVELTEWSRRFRLTKQQHLDCLLEAGIFRVFDDVIKLILQSKHEGLRVGAVSSSENARKVLEMIPVDQLRRLSGAASLTTIKTKTLAEIFDITALGAVSYWPGVQIDKGYHYAMAYGKLLGSSAEKELPRIVVFEDSASSIAEAKKLGFVCIGISRNQNSNEIVSTKNSMLSAGADLVFSDREMAAHDYWSIKSLLSTLLDT